MRTKKPEFKDELSKQYHILIKAEKKFQKIRTFSVLIIFILTFVSTCLCVFFSYKSYKNTSNILNEKTNSTTYYQTLNVVYNNSKNFNLDNIVDNFSMPSPMILIITNDGNIELSYNIMITDISTSLITTNNLTYTITENNQTSVAKKLPTSNANILEDIIIKPKETKKYLITASYNGNIDETQNNYYHAKINVYQSNSKSSLLE